MDMDPWNPWRTGIRIRAVDPNSAGHFDQGRPDVERLLDDGFRENLNWTPWEFYHEI